MRFSKYLVNIIGVSLLLFSLGVSNSYGMTDHSHHHMAKPVSPFESNGKSAHCLLRGHTLNKPCPHILNSQGNDKDSPAINVDCGGAPFPQKLALSGADFQSIICIENINFGQMVSYPMIMQIVSYKFKIHPNLSPPPKFL